MKIVVDRERKIIHAVSVMNLLPKAEDLRNISDYNNSEIGKIQKMLSKATDDGEYSILLKNNISEETKKQLIFFGYKISKKTLGKDFYSGEKEVEIRISW